MDDGDANSQCRNVARGWECVRAYDRENMKRFSLGSQNLTKLNRMTSSICIGFFMTYDMTLVENYLSLRNLPLFKIFENKTPDFKRHLEQDCKALITISILTTT